MFSFTNLGIGIIVVAIGVVSLKYNFQVVGITGRQDWIERRLGGGSTYFAFKLFSVLAIFAGLIFMTGLSTPFFTWLLSPLRGLLTPPSQ